MGLRSEGSETYSTNSQMKVTKFYSEPRWYKDSAGGWQRVNNNVVADPVRPGVFKNAGAAWTATFDVAGNGVDLQVGGQDVRLHIVGDPTVAPEKDPKDSTVVWYRGIRAGVDLKYQISATGIEESYVVATREALAAGGFASGFESAGGLVPDSKIAGSRDFDWDGNGKTAFDGDTDGPKVRIDPPTVADSSGMPLVAAKAGLSLDGAAELAAGSTRWTRAVGVNVDPSLALTLSDAQFPVTVDPQIQIVPSSMGGYWYSFNQGGNLTTTNNQWGLLGNWRIFNGDDRWRFAISMGYQYLWTNLAPNAQVFSANMQLDLAQYPTAAAPVFDSQWSQFPTSGTANNVNVCQASAWNYAGTNPGWGGCTDYYNYGYAPAASMIAGYPGTTYVDVTQLLRPWVATHNPGGVFGVAMDDLPSGVYDFKATIPSLQVVWDQPSPAAPLVGPADGATIASSTPTLSVGAVTDPDSGQNPPMYSAVIYPGRPNNLAGSDPTSNCQANSAIWSSPYTQNQTSWTVPTGVLQDGVTYYWSVATMGTYPGYPTCSGPWKFKVDSRMGTERPYPNQTVGPFTVNAATGNLIAGAASHTVHSVGGAIGPSFSYNSQAPFQNGLRASFYGGTPPVADLNPTLTFSQPSFAQRIDPQINFNWVTKGPTNDADLDNWLGQWTGYVTVPTAGSYCFGTNADDGTKVYIGGTLVMSNWVDHTAADNQCTTQVTFAAGETKSIAVQYYDHTAQASLQLKVFGGPTGTQVVPSGWLSPELHPLGPGWTMAAGDVSVSGARMTGSGITLIRSDGTTVEYTKNTAGAYVGPASDATRVRVDRVSGDIQVDDDSGISYHFASDGTLRSAVSATDDRQPAATQYVWSGNPVRMTGMVDPVGSKTVTLSYGGDAACSSPPSGFVIAPGQLCQVKSWDNRITDLFYNTNLQLARVVNPGGATTDYSYGTNNRITSVRDPLAYDAEFNDTVVATKRTDDANLRWAVVYDGSGRVDHISSPAPAANIPASEQTTTFHYVSGATSSTFGETTVNVSGVSEPNGYSAKLHFDDSLRIREAYDVAARLAQTTYDGVSDRVPTPTPTSAPPRRCDRRPCTTPASCSTTSRGPPTRTAPRRCRCLTGRCRRRDSPPTSPTSRRATTKVSMVCRPPGGTTPPA